MARQQAGRGAGEHWAEDSAGGEAGTVLGKSEEQQVWLLSDTGEVQGAGPL